MIKSIFYQLQAISQSQNESKSLDILHIDQSCEYNVNIKLHQLLIPKKICRSLCYITPFEWNNSNLFCLHAFL